MAAILVGFVWGVARGDPMKGVLLGTAVGLATAILIYAVDRRRRRS